MLLSAICYTPLLGALMIMFLYRREFFPDNPREHESIKWMAFAFSLFSMVLSFVMLLNFESDTHKFQFVEKVPWITSIGVYYFFGVDGISILLIMLTTILSAISILSSFTAIHERQKEYYICLLFLETGMLGVFMALDFFLFYVFWEVMLVPMYFLIGVWGGPRKLYAAIKFFLYTLFGSVLMLLGILALYFLYPELSGTGTFTFDYEKLLEIRDKIPADKQFWIFLAFFVSFAIKVPMWPFHTWLPDAHVEAPTAGSVILAGVLLKMGTYGFVRFSLPLLPQASHDFVPFMATLAIMGIIWGALCTLAQRDVKSLVAYSSVSHLGFVMLGIFALNPEGIKGAILQMVNHGISTGALFLIVGMIYERRHTRMIEDFGGLSKQIPIFAVIFAITMFSSMGLPGLNGFVGEFLILLGVFGAIWWWAIFAVAGIVLGAVYMLWLYQRMMFGEVTHEENRHLTDCNLREIIYMLPLILFMFWIGLYPKPYLTLMESSVNNLIKVVEVKKTAQIDEEKGKVQISMQDQELIQERVHDFLSHSELKGEKIWK